MDDAELVRLFYPPPAGTLVRWDAVNPQTNEPLARLEISEEQLTMQGNTVYIARFGFNDGTDARLHQRVFHVPRWQSLNVMGLTMSALMKLEYAELCSDEFPMDAYEREHGSGSAIPDEVVRRRW